METRKLLLEVPGLLVLDEGHVSRNTDTQILRSLMHVHTKRRILLSGTLFQNNFEELFNLLKLVRPDFMRSKPVCMKILCDFLQDQQNKDLQAYSKTSNRLLEGEALEQKLFVECLGNKVQSGSAEQQNDAMGLLRQLTDSFVHRYKGKVLETLPGLIDYMIILSLTQAQESVFLLMKSQGLNKMDREIRSALATVHPSLCRSKVDRTMQQTRSEVDIESSYGPSIELISDSIDPMHGAKANFVMNLVNLCQDLNEKVLIFSQYMQPLHLLKQFFKQKWGWLENCQMLRLDGQTSTESRKKTIEMFNMDPASRVMLASIRACGEGVWLVGASRVVFLDLVWNPAIIQQAISRAFRIGQHKKVYAYRLVCAGTLDEEIRRVALKKQWIAKAISQADDEVLFDCHCHEVNPQEEDQIFESAELRKLVTSCYQISFA